MRRQSRRNYAARLTSSSFFFPHPLSLIRIFSSLSIRIMRRNELPWAASLASEQKHNWIWKKQLSSQSADELGEREYIYFCVCIIKEHSANSFEREINTPRRSGKNKPESNWANYEQQQLVAARSMSRKRFHFIFNHSRTAWRFASIELKFIIKFEAARALQSHYYSFSTTIIKLKRFNWHNGCRGINLA